MIIQGVSLYLQEVVMSQIPRKLLSKLLYGLHSSPVVFVNGPRQAGKSTLVQKLAEKDFPAKYITFDNTTQMAAAAVSPHEFLTSHNGSIIIDEVQMVPEIFRALKMVVDEIRLKDKRNSNGRYLLTGSANIMALPKLSDPLVGRMSVMTLYPIAACEAFGGSGTFLESLFAANFGNKKPKKHKLTDAISHATFPEISGKDAKARLVWFEGYLTTILQRDVHMLSELEKIAQLPNLLRIIAARAGNLMNDASISRDAGLNAVTSRSYRNILQAMFLTFDIHPWYRNISKRLVKSPKGYLTDTMLLCHMQGWNHEDMHLNKPHMFGQVAENFVACELLKLISFSDVRANLLHFRTSDSKEADFVLERPDGTLAAIEVKISDAVNADDFKGIKELQNIIGNDLICGIVLYQGQEIVPFGKNLFAVPISYLWQ